MTCGRQYRCRFTNQQAPGRTSISADTMRRIVILRAGSDRESVHALRKLQKRKRGFGRRESFILYDERIAFLRRLEFTYVTAQPNRDPAMKEMKMTMALLVVNDHASNRI